MMAQVQSYVFHIAPNRLLFGPVCSGCWEVCITAAAVRLDYKECGRHTRCLAANLMEVIPFLAVFTEDLELSLADWQGLGGWDKLGATIFVCFSVFPGWGPCLSPHRWAVSFVFASQGAWFSVAFSWVVSLRIARAAPASPSPLRRSLFASCRQSRGSRSSSEKRWSDGAGFLDNNKTESVIHVNAESRVSVLKHWGAPFLGGVLKRL